MICIKSQEIRFEKLCVGIKMHSCFPCFFPFCFHCFFPFFHCWFPCSLHCCFHLETNMIPNVLGSCILSLWSLCDIQTIQLVAALYPKETGHLCKSSEIRSYLNKQHQYGQQVSQLMPRCCRCDRSLQGKRQSYREYPSDAVVSPPRNRLAAVQPYSRSKRP